jgi:hypothetical protein
MKEGRLSKINVLKIQMPMTKQMDLQVGVQLAKLQNRQQNMLNQIEVMTAKRKGKPRMEEIQCFNYHEFGHYARDCKMPVQNNLSIQEKRK